jgi:hypothetical protein
VGKSAIPRILWEILKQLVWERKVSGVFRSVCKEWQEAHDSMVPSLPEIIGSYAAAAVPPPDKDGLYRRERAGYEFSFG